MTPRQKEIFYQRTGFQEFENYLESLRDKGESEIIILDSEYWFWEVGFASYCMKYLEFRDIIRKGIRVAL